MIQRGEIDRCTAAPPVGPLKRHVFQRARRRVLEHDRGLRPHDVHLCANKPVSLVHEAALAERAARDPHRHAIELASRRGVEVMIEPCGEALRQFDLCTDVHAIVKTQRFDLVDPDAVVVRPVPPERGVRDAHF